MPKFKYVPRYYDPEKEEWEKKKAARGLDADLSDSEKLRAKMRNKWGRVDDDGYAKKRAAANKLRYVIIFGFAALAIYFIFFTPLVENFINMFLKLGEK
ncbi:MAG: hypothetical protein IKQ09_10285 [Bacteroidales bacterium]|nr:hypothetical protein [Bacteroidales bacterium]